MFCLMWWCSMNQSNNKIKMSLTKRIETLFKGELKRCLLVLQENGHIGRESDITELLSLCIVPEKVSLKKKEKEEAKALKLKEKEEAKALKLKEKEAAKALKLKEKEKAKALKLKEKEEAKALKLKEKEAAKALKLKEKEDAKAAKLKEKEDAKAAKLKEKEDAKAVKLKMKEEKATKKLLLKEYKKCAKLAKKKLKTKKVVKVKTVDEQVKELVDSELEEEDEVDVEVQVWSHKSRPNETLYINEDQLVFSSDQELIGQYDAENDVIYPAEE